MSTVMNECLYYIMFCFSCLFDIALYFIMFGVVFHLARRQLFYWCHTCASYGSISKSPISVAQSILSNVYKILRATFYVVILLAIPETLLRRLNDMP